VKLEATYLSPLIFRQHSAQPKCEIDYARPRRKGSRPSIVSLILGDLQKFYDDKYGAAFPDGDAGRDDLIVLLHYVAQLGDPRAMRACAAHRRPWLSDKEYAAMIARIERKPCI
jgi:hypothetical protein